MKEQNKIDHIFTQLISRKTQLMAAGLMLVLSAGPIASAYFYVPEVLSDAEAQQASLLPDESWETEEAPTTAAVIAASTEAERAYIPTPGELNLAYYFPEGSDTSKKTESLAGQAFKTLTTHDENWISNIYDMADASPVQMASSLGKSKSAVTGKYNFKDERHDLKNPDSWTINSFKQVRMTFTNGDGQPVSAYSNVIDIMSMANIYTYFKGVEDYDLFLSYAQNLWDKSHSYTVGISGIYYCDGCLSKDGEQRELEELEAEARAEESGLAYSAAQETSAAEETTAAGEETAAAESAASSVITAGLSKPVETTEAETVPPETVPESTAGVIVAGQTAPETTEADTAAVSTETTEDLSLEASQEATPADAAASTESPDKKNSDPSAACPGHVDLIVNVKVIGIDETNGLFQLDNIGNDAANIEENGWPGWNRYTRASARLLSDQDWFDRYGLSLSVISMRNPLSEGEIESYLNQLPDGLSQTRKDIIRFALSSVGKVPYYWGGKPSSANYAGNSFGVLTAPDTKGRILKGLDCSGWINWVYWSATGSRLPYESTSGLALCGTKIRRSELQPGDIIVRTGADAHVIMFLGWTSDGKIRCIHESSAGVNNVTVAIRDANWPYYRRLVE